MAPALKFKDELDVTDERDSLDVPLSLRAETDLAAGLESARRDIASGRPLTPWTDFLKHADDEE